MLAIKVGCAPGRGTHVLRASGTGITPLPLVLMAYVCTYLQVAWVAAYRNGQDRATYVPRQNICFVLPRYFVSHLAADINRLLLQFSRDTALWVTVDNEFNHRRVDDALSEAGDSVKRFSPLYR